MNVWRMERIINSIMIGNKFRYILGKVILKGVERVFPIDNFNGGYVEMKFIAPKMYYDLNNLLQNVEIRYYWKSNKISLEILLY